MGDPWTLHLFSIAYFIGRIDGDFHNFLNINFGWHFLWIDVFSDLIGWSAWSNISWRNKCLHPTKF